MQAAAAALHALGLRRPTSAACGAAGAGAWAAVARLRPARTARPQLRVQLSPVVFVQLRSSIAARPPRRGPGWEALPSLSAPGTGGWGPRLLLLRAREKRGDRRDPPPCRAGEARREARESRELGDRAPLLFPACGALGRRGDFGGTDLRGGVRGMGAGNWGQCWRGLGWSAERARAGGRSWSGLTPRAWRCWCTSDLSSGSLAPAGSRPWPGAVSHGACPELWSPGSSGPCLWRARWS